MSVLELALQRNKYKHLSDEEWRWFLQQAEGRERTADKLPAFADIEDWWYPVRLSCEQCSSEQTARYKASIVQASSSFVPCPLSLCTFLDLTAGYGVDTWFIGEHFGKTDYVEQNAELCRIAEHNFQFRIHNSQFTIYNTTAEAFLQTAGQYDLIFADPARRDSHGGKVFRLADCTPDVTELLPALLQHLTPNGRLMFKLSPMLDITQAVNELSLVPCALSPCTLTWDVHVVAVKNEVKEVLLFSARGQDIMYKGTITAIDLAEPEKAFVFTKEEERNAPSSFQFSPFTFLYEPSAAILKAGAYKLVAQRFGLHKLDVNTHLYASDQLMKDFPGRVWKCLNEPINAKMVNGQTVNVVVRNYPLTPEQLKKKYRLKDGGDMYLIGCRVNGKPTLYTAERIENK